jgi:hypothetical protein
MTYGDFDTFFGIIQRILGVNVLDIEGESI